MFKPSPIEQIHFRGRDYYLKRDDLLDPAFSGNKARKFYYFLMHDFPGVTKIIGHGSPQANSLYSLSELAKLKGWQLDYYVDHIASFLKEHPAGNYRAALGNGARILSLQDIQAGAKTAEKPVILGDYLQSEVLSEEPEALFIPEGGRSHFAESGVKLLAEEIISWAETRQLTSLKVFLPAGTGTTAVYLQKHLPFEVLTCACVGGTDYLSQQFFELCSDPKVHPRILAVEKKYHFGKLYDVFLEIWQALKDETGVEFDLLYDPLGWLVLLDYLDGLQSEHADSPQSDILYIHQGGLLGNETMLPRYAYAAKRKKHLEKEGLNACEK